MTPKNCQGCIYAEVDPNNGRQLSCNLRLAEKIGFTETESHYELNGVCLSKNKPEDIRKVRMGYIFIIKPECQDALTKLAYSLSLVKNNMPLWIGVSVYTGFDIEALIKLMNNYGVLYDILENYDEIYDKHKIDQFMKKFKHGWTYVNILGEYFNHNAKHLIDHAVYNECKKFAFVSNADNTNAYNVNDTCFFNTIYKYLKGSIPSDDGVTNHAFARKLEIENSNMLCRWKDLGIK